MTDPFYLWVIIALLVIALVVGYACYSDLRREIQTIAIGLANQIQSDSEAVRYQLDEIEKQQKTMAERLINSNMLTDKERQYRNEQM